jgi:LmbE family N-acetylglucosaminyl deacetylase
VTARPSSGSRTLHSMATIVSIHAHPDDEAIVTGGTLARLAAEGHRVVVVVACDGAMWPHHGTVRLERFRASAAILGAARTEHLGYADSGHGPVLFEDPPGRVRFARADLDEAAGRLSEIIRSEDADLLLSYDAAGGYGHPDHVKVHRVGARAAELTGVRVLEATGPRELVIWVFRLLGAVRLVVRHPMREVRGYGTPRAAITHRVNVRRYATVKQKALAAHVLPERGKGRMSRVWRLAVALPAPVFCVLWGREWFAEPGATPGGPVRDHVLPSGEPSNRARGPRGRV